MSWDNTYSHTVLLAADRAGAAVIFNEPDITISSLCWIVRQADEARFRAQVMPLDKVAFAALAELKLYGWQLTLLRCIDSALEYFWPGHCAAARQGDLDTSARSRRLLGAT